MLNSLKRLNRLCIVVIVLNFIIAGTVNSYAKGYENQQEIEAVSDAIIRMYDAMAVEQNADGSFTGAIEADPSVEVLFLLTAKEISKDTPELEAEVLHRVFFWKGDDVAWSFRPGGEPSVDITGVILYGLQKLGIGKNDDRVKDAWEWFEAAGGNQSLNLVSILILQPLNLATFRPMEFFTPLFFALPLESEINVWNIGVLRNLLIPLIVQQFYEESPFVLPVSQERIDSNGSHLAKPHKQPIKLFPKNFWAQEGLGFMIGHQQPDGAWYAFQATYLYTLMLKSVHDRGVADLQEEIDKAWNGMLNIKKYNINNEMFISVSDSTGWDTSRLLMALQTIPSNLQNNVNGTIQRGIDWLLEKQLFNKGDWSHNAPELRPGGWSFVPDNIWLPDTDVSAAAIESLVKFKLENPFYRPDDVDIAISRGLEWVLGMQNDHGGFPAWDTNCTTLLPFLLGLLHEHPPMIEDVGQPDLTARIIQMLHDIDERVPEFSSIQLRNAIEMGNEYLVDSRVQTNPNLWRGDWAVNYLYGTSTAISALLASGYWSLDEAEETLDWIASMQHEDGGWGEDHISFIVEDYIDAPSTAMQTGYIIECFLTYEERYVKVYYEPSSYRPVIKRAIDYLISAIDHNGRTHEKSHTGVLLKQVWYADYAMVPEIRTMSALGRYLTLLQDN